MKLTKPIAAIITLALASGALFACGDSSDDSSFDYSAGLDSNGFFKDVKASDIVTLPEYKGVAIDPSILEATDEQVQEQIDGVLESYTDFEHITDRAVEDGDRVNIDYVGSIDGVEFEGGSTGGAGTDVTIGVTQYIDDFLEQLIGHMPGENFDIEVTFPEDYGNAELNGKDAIFNITINYILNVELTDNIAAEYGFSSVDELIADIEDFIVDGNKFDLFSDLLLEATCSNIPESVLNYVIDSDIAQYSYYSSLYGITVDELIQQLGYESRQAYIDANMATYQSNATQYLAAQAIAELEGITVTEDDIAASDYAGYVESYGEPYIKQCILIQEKLPDFIVENGVVG